jgi:hypothetical protein
MADIFKFWSRIERGAFIHPADKEVFARIDAKRHGFELNCLPGCFGGPLKTAPVVLLYLSPGFSKLDVADAKTDDGKDYHLQKWQGCEPFRDNGPGNHSTRK